jgi:hypothetical protein
MIIERAIRRYGNDPEFIRGLASLRSASDRDAERVAGAAGMLLLPPLSLATGRAPVATRWLEEHDFSVEYVHRLRLTDEHIRRVWKYQIATDHPDRIRVVSQLLTHGPSLLLGVVGRTDGPAATRLCELKGPSDIHRLSPRHLRTHLGAGNMFNNLAHTPDGPAEAIRELASLLDDAELAHCWRRMSAAVRGARGAARDEALAAVPAEPPHGGVSLVHVAAPIREAALAALPAGLGPARRAAHDEAAWAAGQSWERPLEVLAEFRARFQPSRWALDAPMEPPVTVYAELDKALFDVDFDLDRLLEAAAESGLEFDARARAVVSTEWLSRRYQRPRTDAVLSPREEETPNAR